MGQHVPAHAWGWLVSIGVLHTGIAYVLMNSAFPCLTTPVIGIITFIFPVVAIIIDWAVYGHPLGPAQAAGMALIAVATLGVRLGWRFPLRRVSAA
nr:EamA family transporter [Mesorhizobium sp. B2-4-19]